MPAPSISIVIPAFNEEQHIEQTVLGVIGLLDSSKVSDYEILIFDDGSTDGTGAIAEDLSRRYTFIRSFHFKQNQGLGHVARSSISEARKDYIMWHSGDGSVDSQSLVPAVRSIGKADIIVAYLENQNDRTWIRSTLSRSFVALYNTLFRLKLKYYNGPSIFPCKVLRGLSIKSDRYEFWAEIMVRCLKLGLTYIEMPFIHKPPAEDAMASVRLRNVSHALRIALILMGDLLPGRTRALMKRVGLVLLSLLIGVLISEGVVRVFKLAPEVRAIDTSDPNSPYKRSANPILGYEHKANYRNPEADLITSIPRTNVHGQRDVERSIEKPEGVTRVILLGDSVVESKEVGDIEQVLHRQLERLYPDNSVEVLNFGVNGYCTLAEIELLRVKGLAFRPDVVVVVFVWNDYFNLNTAMHALASRPRRSAAVKGLFKRSHLFRSICIRLNLFGFAADANAHQWNADAIGENNVVAGLTMLKALATENGFQPAIAIWPQFKETQILDSPTVRDGDRALIIERLAAFHGIPTFRLSPYFAQDHTTRGASVGPSDTYTIGDGMHPNEEGSRIAAVALKEVLDAMADPSRAAQPAPSEAEYDLALSRIRATEKSWAQTSKLQALRVDEVTTLADTMLDRGRLADAIELYRKAIVIDGENAAWIHESLADALQLAGSFGEAVPHYREALRSRPGSAEAQHKWGLALDRTGQPRSAVDHYQLALLLDPNMADAYYNLGNALQKLDRHQDAIRNYQRTVQLRRNDVEARINLGISLYTVGRIDEALACGEEAVRLAPGHVKAQYNLAMMYLGRRQAGLAVEHFEQALKYDPDYAQASEGLRAAREMMGEGGRKAEGGNLKPE